MAHALADETLKDILARVLDVPDADFASDADVSPFALRQFSTADILLVCKRWMRVATPLLYHTVVLRSTAQAQALAKALKKNPSFGVYLKKLRIEGGFGASVGRSILAASGITDLCISLNIGLKDNIKSTCEALPSMRPHRLILIGLSSSNGAPARAVHEGLLSTIPLWSSLRCIVFSAYSLSFSYHSTILQSAGSNVKELCMSGHRLTASMASLLVSLLSNLPSVETVRLHIEKVDDAFDAQEQRTVFASHYPKIVFPALHDSFDMATAPDLSPLHIVDGNSSYAPMQASPLSVQRAIWTLVLEHVLFSHQPFQDSCGTAAFLSVPYEDQQRLSVTGALRHMQVCKLFRDIGLELAARAVRLTNTRRWDTFAAVLHEKPHLAASVRGVFATSATSRLDFEHHLLGMLTGLRRFAGDNISLSGLVVLSRGAGSTLHQLELRSLDGATISSPLHFPVLRRLQVTKFVGELLTSTIWDMPLLEELNLEHGAAVLIPSFEPLDLSHLQYLSLPATDMYRPASRLRPFLVKHGQKCTKLRTRGNLDQVLPHCPNLRVLNLSFAAIIECDLTDVNARLPALTKLHAPSYYDEGRGKIGRAMDEQWMEFFDCLARDRLPNPGPACNFPALSEVVIASLEWPTQPQEIAQSRMVKWAEEMQAKGIRVLAQDGTAWRTRLKTKK